MDLAVSASVPQLHDTARRQVSSELLPVSDKCNPFIPGNTQLSVRVVRTKGAGDRTDPAGVVCYSAMNRRKKESVRNTVTILALLAATIYIGFYFLVAAR